MKKLLQILAVAVLTVTTFATSSGATSTGTCAVGFTGPDSNNKCISESSYTCEVKNDTNVAIVNDGTQVSVSGDATSGGNTGAGSTSTGSASNSNGTQFNVTVTNGSDLTAKTCKVVAVVPATLTTTPTETTPLVAAPAGQGAASSLPNTSGDPVLSLVVGLAGLMGVVAVVSRLAVVAYSRVKR